MTSANPRTQARIRTLFVGAMSCCLLAPLWAIALLTHSESFAAMASVAIIAALLAVSRTAAARLTEWLSPTNEVSSIDAFSRTEDNSAIPLSLFPNLKQNAASGAATRASANHKDALLPSVWHRIRTPLNGVIGMAELLRNTELTERQAHFCGTILDSGTTLLGMLNDVLDLSRIEAGNMELTPVEFHLPDLLAEAMAPFATDASDRGIELICNAAIDAQPMVIGDRQRLLQVLTNLLSNAVKFTERGEVVLEAQRVRSAVAAAAATAQKTFSFTVRDSGIGIAPEQRAQLFDASATMLLSALPQSTGTGLSLALSQHLVALMGGELNVVSTPQQGSTFSFAIPLLVASDQPSAPQLPMGRIDVYLVDASPASYVSLTRKLTNWGANCQRVSLEHLFTTSRDARGTTLLALINLEHCGAASDELLKRLASPAARAAISPIVFTSAASLTGLATTNTQTPYQILRKPLLDRSLFAALTTAIARNNADVGETSAQPAESAQQKAKFDETLRQNPPHVLLVEDNLINQEVATEHLRDLGCVVTIANNGAEALDAFSANRFALVFMDCQMPVMDGYDATRGMRAIENERAQTRTPIVALTANALRGDRDRCLVAGMDDFYSKPFTRNDLRAALERWLRRSFFARPVLTSNAESLISQPRVSDGVRANTATACDATACDATASDVNRSIDTLTWEQLLQLGKRSPGLIERVLSSFHREAVAVMPVLMSATAPSEDLRFAAHRMKSAARSLGALALGEVLAALEAACHEENSNASGEAVPSLAAQACDEIRAALRALSQLGNQPLELAADATINAPAPSAPMALHEEAARAAMANSSARAVTTKSNAADEHTLGASAIANTGSDESTRGHRALIADDDEVSRSIVASWLRSDGYFVVEAADGQIALDHFARDEFDLILLDVLMPVRNGYETCKSIRELPHGRHIPIVMLTGLDDDEAVHFAYECGATDFIIKPIVEEILRNRLRYIQRAGRLSDELRRSEARLRRAQLAARVSYWEWDPQTRQMHVGEGVAHLLNDAIADDTTAIDTVRALFGAEDQHVIERILAGETIDAGTLENQRVDAGGTLTYIAQRVECIVDTVTGKTRWLGTVQDITEQRRNEQRIYRISHFDSLTGMPNQLFLSKSLGMFLKLAHRQQKRVAYLVIDSGEQQQIASALGHDYHDQYVLEIANRLRTQLRGSDLFVRLPDPDGLTNAEDARAALVHGDRFSAALNSIGGHEDVARISERLIEALAIPIELGSEALFPRINIGIAMFPEDGEDFETLHQHALTALNQIGDNQQTGYHWYQQERDAAARERIALERDLRYAVERGELRVFYQPRLDAHTGAVLGMEALVRWQRDGQMISPARFIPIAEQTGVINQLGEYVLERSVAMLAAWLKRGLPPLRVSVNVSGRQFRESNLPALCSAALTRHKLPPEYLELELTEGILIDASDNVLQQLHVLNDMGINLALDDFGTGFSSLGYLSRFPLHVLKIDKSFVDKLNDNEHNRVIVRSTLTLAHDLGLRVVAEGVETEAQRQWLVDHACDELQGYLFAKPLPPDEFEHWVLQHASAPPMSPTTIVRSNVQ